MNVPNTAGSSHNNNNSNSNNIIISENAAPVNYDGDDGYKDNSQLQQD
jgi:hypothetical protein